MQKKNKQQNSTFIDLENLGIDNVILLNDISTGLIEEFNKLPEQIFNVSNKSKALLFTTVFSRNYYQCNLFLYCCYLVLLDKILSSNPNIKKIIVPSKAFKKVLKEYLLNNSNSIIIEDISRRNFKLRLKNFLWTNFGILYAIKYCIKLFVTKNSSRTKKIISEPSVKLIDTFILQNSIDKGIYIERNYPGIFNYIKDKHKSSIFFAPHIVGRYKSKDLQKIYDSSTENIVFKRDFLKIQDYIYSLISITKIGNISKQPIIFKKFNISPLIKHELALKKYTKTISALLNFNFIKRLKNKKTNLKSVINWFENQNTDKGFNLGVNTFYPNISHVGYMGFNFTDTFIFYTIPTKFEIKHNVIPKTLAVIGDAYTKYHLNINSIVSGGFRFTDLWNIQNSEINKIILVVLPLNLRESIEILELLIISINKTKSDNIIYQIKPHPAFNKTILNQHFQNNWPSYFEFVNGDFIKLMSNSKLVIGSGTTSCFEPLALGIPVIIIGSQTNLTRNPIPLSINKKIWKIVYNADALIFNIDFFLNLDANQIEEFKEIGFKIKTDYFSNVTSEKFNNFFNI